QAEAKDDATPEFDAAILVEGRTNVWDMAFLPGPEQRLLFTERQGSLNVWSNGQVRQVVSFADVVARGEGGLMGVAVDPQFESNRSVYACLNSSAGDTDDIRVIRLRLDADNLQPGNRQDIVTGITANPSGRHSGCRLAFGPDGYLWIGTGDAALGAEPQQPDSLNGKILRVGRDGRAAPGNLGQAGFDARIYSYGHRNTQGLAFFPKVKNGVIGLSAEHGSNIDDELNPLSKGNFGWAPAAGYGEQGVPMTDRQRFPDAVQAVWSSGEATQAPSGIAIINSSAWRGWDGAAVVAILKDKHLKVLRLDNQNKVTREERALEAEYGRLRAVVQGPDDSLYVSTDNNSNDKIIRLTPRKN
ncbi:MAG: PQQ-dependent sugar dehydrogenase, partial [Pseudomonas sp.]